jgi:D-sedoheptulose 7-phosphate isomerase
MLAQSRAFDVAGNSIPIDEAFTHWRDLALATANSANAVYIVGNGASASMASHFSADLAKNGCLHTQVFTDCSLMTAVANDLGYEQVFAEPLRRRGRNGDLLVAVSSSGRSPNVLLAAATARELGISVVTLTGKSTENPLKTAGDINFHVPAETYGMVETCHAALLHWWMDLVQLSKGPLT